MPKLGKEKRDEIIKIVRQMRVDDVAWDTIMQDSRIKGFIKNKETLMKWLEGGPAAPRAKRSTKTDDAEIIKELRKEIERLQALVSDLLLGKIKLGKA